MEQCRYPVGRLPSFLDMGRYTTYPLTEMEYIPLSELVQKKRPILSYFVIGFVIGFALTLI